MTRKYHDAYSFLKFSAQTLLIFSLLILTVVLSPSPPVEAIVETADGFNYPVGSRNPGFVTEAIDTDGWFNAQDFGEDNPDFGGLHPGEDWNDDCGGINDIGAPVYAVAHGKVVGIKDLGNSAGALPGG